MLLAINDRIKGWLGAVIIGLIGLPFALWGIQSYIGGGTEQIAATVGDREISLRELENSTSQLRQRLQQQSDQLPDDQALQRQALDQMINTTMLETETLDQGYRISDQLLAARVRQLFQRDGSFDKDYFVRALASQGMSPQMFEQRYRNELRMQQQQSAITRSAIISDAELRRMIQLNKQTRDIVWLKLNVDKLAGDIDITDEDVTEYYNSNISSYMTPAQASIEYIELTADDLPAQDVDEEQLHRAYEDYVAAAKQKEERKARHILIGTGEDKAQAKLKALDIRAQILDGADFSLLAKKYSEDTGSASEGGDLGWVATGQMVKPFEDALFKLEKSSVSEIVETEFGYHLIMLDDIRGVEVKSFADMRDQLLDELQLSAVDGAMYEMSELLANTAYENPDSLEPAAEALNIKIKSSAMFSAKSGTGIAGNAAVRKAAFSDPVLKQGENSELIEIGRNHVVVLRLKQHNPASPVPLADLRNTVIEALKLKKGEEITRKISEQMIRKLEQGVSIDEVLQPGVTKQDGVTVSVKDSGGLGQYFTNAVMAMPPPTADKATYKYIGLSSGDGALVVLQKVNLPADVDEALLKQARLSLKQVRSVADFNTMIEAYREQYAVHINQKVFEQ